MALWSDAKETFLRSDIADLWTDEMQDGQWLAIDGLFASNCRASLYELGTDGCSGSLKRMIEEDD